MSGMQNPILVKLKMKKSYKSALFIIGLLIIALVFIYIMYLFYDKVMDNEDIEVKGMISINYADGKNFKVEKTDTLKFSVSNNDEKVNYYSIGFSQIRGTGSYRLIANDKVVMEGILNTVDEISAIEVGLDALDTKIYTLEINNDGSEPIKGNLNIRVQDSKIVTFADTILKNNEIKTPSTTVGEDIAIENEGLIKDTDDIGVTYYFRGNVDNNYVDFANLKWRIVRINGDGTVRLILDGVADTLASYYSSSDKNYDYKESNINEYLKSWLEEKIPDYNKYLANSQFCNDMTNDDGIYLSYTRIYTNKIPTFNCLATSFNSNIGILTIDELVLAGASPSNANDQFYLYNADITDSWYTMSGAKKDINQVNLFMFDSKGNIKSDINGSLYHSVRPVINIIKNIEVKGEGSIDNPYVIE